jgi:Cu-Zn family superoxide dismutase
MCRTTLFLALGLSLAACRGGKDTASKDTTGARDTAATAAGAGRDTGAAAGGSVTAAVRDASGRSLGTLTITETASGIAASGRLTGLPSGEHAIHIHTVGRCDPPFASAGGHWNPTNRQHGTQNPQGPHFGDLPNIKVGTDSSVTVQATTPGGTLRGNNALLDADGAAVVIHAKPDDYRTDPAGNAGDRIACGVISAS